MATVRYVSRLLIGAAALLIAGCSGVHLPAAGLSRPWLDPELAPEKRAELALAAMTDDEKFAMLHGYFAMRARPGMPAGSAAFFGPIPDAALGSAGYVPGVERLGIPSLQESDASLGVANPQNVRPGDGATPLPSSLLLAATWNPDLAYGTGRLLGDEAFRKGFNVMLAGGVNLARDPRNGRNFEYLGEDALLAGTLAGEAIRGIQSQHVVSTAKHFAVNDQETGRMVLDARIAEDAMRESDLLAFELAIERGDPGSVMCAYNKVNGTYACENPHLLTDVLRRDWGWRGWVMSDWGAVHGAAGPALAGLDQESGQRLDREVFFDAPLKEAVANGQVPAARIDEMVRRILYAIFAKGLADHPAAKSDIDYAAHTAEAQGVAEQGIVLLQNRGNLLPLSRSVRRIAVIGGNANIGVLSGGGSSQVLPVGGAALAVDPPKAPFPGVKILYDPSSPLEAIRAMAPAAAVVFADGNDPAEAAKAARGADVAIVFAGQWMTEGLDAPDLSLPGKQDQLIQAVAAANRRTVVVLETGGPVLMPWLAKVPAVLEAWYPGAGGGPAIARILFGAVSPSGRLPITFPASEAQLPRSAVPGITLPENTPIAVDYSEGALVGYRWFAAQGTKPLFPFGHGLSYTRFRYDGLALEGGRTLSVAFTVTNAGKRPALEVAQIYAEPQGAGPQGAGPQAGGPGERRLVGWSKVQLAPGETKRVSVSADPRLLARFDSAANVWRIGGGAYAVSIGPSAAETALAGRAVVDGQTLKP